MEYTELVLLLEMVQKTKTMLTRAAHKKIKWANAKRVRVVREKNERKMSKGSRGDKKKSVASKKGGGKMGSRKEGSGKGIWRGLKALKEIKWYQSSTEKLIRRTPTPDSGMGNCTIILNWFTVPEYGSNGTARSGQSLPSRTIRTGWPLCNTHKACNYYA